MKAGIGDARFPSPHFRYMLYTHAESRDGVRGRNRIFRGEERRRRSVETFPKKEERPGNRARPPVRDPSSRFRKREDGLLLTETGN